MRRANTLSAEVLAELNEALRELDRDPPKGLVIASGKANGFIAGADVDEFRDVRDAAGAIAIVKRGWDTFERLAAVPLSDGRAGSRLLPGRRSRAGTRLPVSRRRRRTRHAPRPAGSDAGHRAGLGRHPAPAAADRRAGGVRPAADRPDHRRAQARSAWASPTNACRRGSWRTPRAACWWRSARRASLPFPLSLTLNPLVRPFIAAQARKPSQGARGASIIPRRTPFSSCG